MTQLGRSCLAVIILHGNWHIFTPDLTPKTYQHEQKSYLLLDTCSCCLCWYPSEIM